ncbi:MAG: hypothetical protein Q7S27_06040 [Nanoarchaeota archaeon]|nr:hypothetical protein [Nanoarchaeota archaeon]
MKGTRPIFVTLLCILLFIITIGLFTSWGYQSVNYILSQSFNVESESTIYDLFIGIIAIIASVLVFIGATYIWKMNYKGPIWVLFGSIGFLIKNILDIINDINPLMKASEVGSLDINIASLAIASDIFQFAFWIFIIIFFNRSSFKEHLS